MSSYRFGVNKKREITRLVYEISKRDAVSRKEILSRFAAADRPYSEIKKALLKLRFPYSTLQKEQIIPHLPKLDIAPENEAETAKLGPFPKTIYAEEAACGSALLGRLRKAFPKACFKRIGSIKDFIKERPVFSIADYNKRRDNFFIVKERHDFFKKCPCTRSAVSCGYHILNTGFGCIFECSYCYLQEYTNSPGIILPSNIDDFLGHISRQKKSGMRVGTGEFTDSLALDNLTQYSLSLTEFFNKNRGMTLEFKTKSADIANLIKVRPGPNIVVSWSLNPQYIIDENEFFTASLGRRLKAALECAKAGYRVGFHFDPIIYHEGWEKRYGGLVNRLFDVIPANKMAWISLGTLRFNPRLKTIIENRFPGNNILGEELFLGFDNKIRYPRSVRFMVYKNMLGWIRKRSKSARTYLCMEDSGIQKALKNSYLI